MKLGIVIQARMGSTRLPGKVLRAIGERSLLAHVMDRLEGLRHDALPVIATSTKIEDNVIASWSESRGIACFRGSESDVLDRYWQCAVRFDFDHIVRLTADNPFTDIVELDRLLDLHLSAGHDYTHSFGQMPIGVGSEVFTREALRRSHSDGLKPNHREHVNEFIEENPAEFRIGRLIVPEEKLAPALRLTVDTADDLARACRLVEAFGDREFSTEEAIQFCTSSA